MRRAIIVAIVVGMIAAGPQLAFLLFEKNYRGVMLSGASDESHSLARIQEVIDGHKNLWSVYLADYRNDAAAALPGAELLLGWVANVTGLGPATLFLGGKFLFPSLAFLLVILLVGRLTGSALAALAGGSLVVLGTGLAGIFGGIGHDFLFFTRLPHPGFSALFFFGWLFLLYRFFEERSLPWAAGSALFLALLAYLYPFYWVFALGVSGILLLWFFWGERDFRSAVIFGAAVGGALLADISFLKVAFPFLGIPALPSAAVPGEGSLDLRRAFIESRAPVLDALVWLALILFGAWYWRFRHSLEKPFLFLLFLLFGAILVSNQQLLSGRLVQVGHFYWFTNVPVAFLAMLVIGSKWIERVLGAAWEKRMLWIGIGVVFLFAIGVQAGSYQAHRAEALEIQRFGSVFSWLRRNVPKDSVVFADERLSEWIPASTDANVYWSRYQAVYPAVPFERLEHNLFLRMRLEGVEASRARDWLLENRNEVGIWLFEGQYFKDLCGSAACFPDEVIDRLAKKYEAFFRRPFDEVLTSYDLDVFIWDTKNYPNWQIPRSSLLVETDRIGDFRIFRVK
ncbi:hypothetical protein HYW30_00085 [Candidatus Azambacteria bacterium]|nr:hypothetical protein [Candidatus Azambacteria bacterium]